MTSVSLSGVGVRKIGVKSRSNPAHVYEVLVYADGNLICPCKGFQFKRHCYHTVRVRKYLADAETKPLAEPQVDAPAMEASTLDQLLGS